MTILFLAMFAAGFASFLESAEIELECARAALEEIEARDGKLIALIAAWLMLEGCEWWEV